MGGWTHDCSGECLIGYLSQFMTWYITEEKLEKKIKRKGKRQVVGEIKMQYELHQRTLAELQMDDVSTWKGVGEETKLTQVTL